MNYLQLYTIKEAQGSTACTDTHHQHILCCVENKRLELEERIGVYVKESADTGAMTLNTRTAKRDAVFH